MQRNKLTIILIFLQHYCNVRHQSNIIVIMLFKFYSMENIFYSSRHYAAARLVIGLSTTRGQFQLAFARSRSHDKANIKSFSALVGAGFRKFDIFV